MLIRTDMQISPLIYREQQLTYFCGQAIECRQFGNKWALQLAKYNVEQHYSVIGVTEEYNATLALFEAVHPEFFKHASDIVKKGQLINRNVGSKSISKLSPEAREIWRFLTHDFNIEIIKKLHAIYLTEQI